MTAPPEHTAASVWPRPYSARERIVISRQAVADRRNIPLLWYWRLVRPDEPGGTAQDEALWEAPRVHRRYADPIGAHLYVDTTPRQKAAKKGVTETTVAALVAVSRAEARRVGAFLQVQDDGEHLVSQPEGGSEFIWVPRPGDLFRFDDDHYEIQQMGPPDRYGPTRLPVVWRGTATLLRDDSTTPRSTWPVPPAAQPPATPLPRGAWRG